MDAENVQLKRWTYAPLTPEAEKQTVIAKWNAWYEENRKRWVYSFGEKVRIFFMDTRFAKYWATCCAWTSASHT